MGRQIIKQLNGSYAVFSTVTDSFILFNASKKDVTKLFIEMHTESIQNELDETFSML